PKALSIRIQDHEASHTPRQTGHREQAALPVEPKRFEGFADDTAESQRALPLMPRRYLSYRRASTGVSVAARQAGYSADAIAINASVPNATSEVSALTGSPGNISGIFTSFRELEIPYATPHPTRPLEKARTQPSTRKSTRIRVRVAPSAFRS